MRQGDSKGIDTVDSSGLKSMEPMYPLSTYAPKKSNRLGLQCWTIENLQYLLKSVFNLESNRQIILVVDP